MIVNVNPRGHSFLGVTAYLMHDKGAQTSERVLWSSTHNLHTGDVERAARFMAWTDQNRGTLRQNAAGAKGRAGNVYHYSLSRTPEAAEGQDWMAKSAHESVQALKLDGHQYYLVAHGDTNHEHVHVVVNLVHPETGRIARIRDDFKTLDRWANEFEKVHGIECEQRAKKYEAWEQDRPAFSAKERREAHARAATEAFAQSDGPAAFQAALEEHGLTLARGNRRGLVLVDREGEIYALNRLVELPSGVTGRAKTKAINERLDGLDRETLQMADDLAAQRIEQRLEPAEVQLEPEPDAAQQREDEEERRLKGADRKLEQRIARHEADAGLDELAAQKDRVQGELAGLQGFWSRIFRRQAIRDAEARHAALSRELEMRNQRLQKQVAALRAEREALEAQLELGPTPEVRAPELELDSSPTLAGEWDESVSTTEDERRAKRDALIEQWRKQRASQERERDRGYGPER